MNGISYRYEIGILNKDNFDLRVDVYSAFFSRTNMKMLSISSIIVQFGKKSLRKETSFDAFL